METVTLISLSLLLIFTSIFAVLYFRERKYKLELRRQVDELKGQTDEDIFGRGKFSELGLMSAGITHEISNPLSIILGRVTQLKRFHISSADEDFQKGLHQIESSAERITNIIQSVREYIYRNEDMDEDIIPLKDIIDNVLVFFGQRLKNHSIELRLNNIEKTYVRGHKGQYEQAILNLVSNSFDAIDNIPEKWIEISAKNLDGQVQIFIKDSGHGIPTEIRERMLDPFFTTKKGKGTGLGLSLVNGIAQKHGGNLKYIDSENTTFLLELPRSSAISYHH